ncbi:TetR/AcrR family transcriptional regulator [Streptomyces subrutilus]|uniref:TetR family transcriptional regulator n=1 Tax=Streptomyces subrutilus TaxID=36818 RepID=A0A5P2UML9_9ACTN|nr:TetR/AcrR family transcriptional regulator [Streptomyces subrutilus]QEU78881.1 TetR/AcrR family transcriptional regulator [Streptomyces subrutilus]WSJ31937.1 TetR/AcrR family transcriptional regulator [Streptomyces subrutilus]GGZ83771.1 TetR family transcriptional regulator [Streptomyces subrutilus]
MPAARESLLDAAVAALAARPWPAVRMVDVAAAAGVSRQTLYNEFGGKAGLGRALVRLETGRYLDGVDRALAAPGSDAERLAAVAEWTVRAAGAHPLLRALLTGARDAALPAPGRAPGPGELARAVRDRAVAALAPAGGARRCELVVRLALSYVVAPGEEPGAGELLRLLSEPNRRAAAR